MNDLELRTAVAEMAAEIASAASIDEKRAAVKRCAHRMAIPVKHGLVSRETVVDEIHVEADWCSIVDEIGKDKIDAAIEAGLAEMPEAANGHFFDDTPHPSGPQDYGLPDRNAPIVTADATPLTLVSAADWPHEAPPPMAWLVRDKIPRGDVSTLDGDGGLGKTMAALQLAIAVAAVGALDEDDLKKLIDLLNDQDMREGALAGDFRPVAGKTPHPGRDDEPTPRWNPSAAQLKDIEDGLADIVGEDDVEPIMKLLRARAKSGAMANDRALRVRGARSFNRLHPNAKRIGLDTFGIRGYET
jgi:hypothetical protein